MVTRGLWNYGIDGKWYRWFHPLRGQSSSPDSPMILKTIQQILYKSNKFKLDAVPFPTPLHFQLYYVYTIDEDAGHFTVTQWKTVNGASYPKTRRAMLASIQETSLNNNHPLSALNDNRDNIQHLFEFFGSRPRTPARLNEQQFQLFTDFLFIWRFYFDSPSIWTRSFSLFANLAIGLLRIAAWDFEVRYADTEELPITFSSLPQWKAPADDVFWFHKYVVVYCGSGQIDTSVATRAKNFVCHSDGRAGVIRGIAISIRHIALFTICNGDISQSPPVALISNTSTLSCSPGFRILAYIFTSDQWGVSVAEPREHWGVTLPTELLEIIIETSTPRDLVSMAQASTLVEKWYYSSIPQLHGFKLQNFALSIPCCGRRDGRSPTGVYCSVCYSWSHMECTELPYSLTTDTDGYICPECQGGRTCNFLETSGIHQAYRAKQKRNTCSAVRGDKALDFRFRDSKPSSRRPELWLIRSHGPPPPRSVDYTIFFSGSFSGLAYGFDE
ncbi:hypothetical protein BJX62DRAFT_223901 [Aspergillus germanicus]